MTEFFLGLDGSGENAAGLFSLIATCEANGVSPTEDLAGVLMRVRTHPASRIDAPPPHRWEPGAFLRRKITQPAQR
jgi:transposase